MVVFNALEVLKVLKIFFCFNLNLLLNPIEMEQDITTFQESLIKSSMVLSRYIEDDVMVMTVTSLPGVFSGYSVKWRHQGRGEIPAAMKSDLPGTLALLRSTISSVDSFVSLSRLQVNLAIMQKQLSEMAIGHPRQSSSGSRQNGFSGGVGALGIMNNRLAETSVDR